eukprot:s403_g13.t1
MTLSVGVTMLGTLLSLAFALGAVSELQLSLLVIGGLDPAGVCAQEAKLTSRAIRFLLRRRAFALAFQRLGTHNLKAIRGQPPEQPAAVEGFNSSTQSVQPSSEEETVLERLVDASLVVSDQALDAVPLLLFPQAFRSVSGSVLWTQQESTVNLPDGNGNQLFTIQSLILKSEERVSDKRGSEKKEDPSRQESGEVMGIQRF